MDQKRLSCVLYTVFCLVSLFQLPLGSSAISTTRTFNIVDYGAQQGGNKDVSDALRRAWNAACAAKNDPASIVIPEGRYLLNPVSLKGCRNFNITINLDGMLEAPSDYRVLGKVENWISFENAIGTSIVAGGGDDGGVVYARGEDWWSCKASGGSCSKGATSVRFMGSRNITISGLKSRNSQMFHIAINGCQNVYIDGVTISAAGDSPNTDGIHVQSSHNVTIVNSNISTGDDCISLGRDDRDIWIENISCGPGHGISIGSLGRYNSKADQVQNVTVKSVVFTGTTNGVRIKTWAKPNKGFVQDVTYQNITLVDVQNPIIIDQNYCEHNKNCPNQASGIQIYKIHYDGISGTSKNADAVKFDCSSLYPCTGIFLRNINITTVDSGPHNQTHCSCSHVRGGRVSGFVKPKICF